MRLFESPVEQEKGSGVTVTTVHAAKGREWRHVLMPFCDQLSYRPKNGEEEERVFFVAASRAIETLTFLYSGSRLDEWKGGEIDVAICPPLERIVENRRTKK
jgi:superfamily I DNA/RNA helicase